MRRRLWLYLAVAVACLSCAAPLPLDVGYHGSDRGYVSALLAADAWNASCDADLVNVHRGEGEIGLYEQSGTVGGQAWGETHISRPLLGLGPKRATEIRFMDCDWALPVIAHEFGHALGLDHEPTGIMKPGDELMQLDPATSYQTLVPGLITAEDCARVAR